jgi:hypothetical protein
MAMKKSTDSGKAAKKVDGILAKGYKVMSLKAKTMEDLKPKKDDSKKKAVGKKKK